METLQKSIHILLNNPEEAAKLKATLETPETRHSVVIHDDKTLNLKGSAWEVVILEHGMESLVWLEVMTRTIRSHPRTQVLLYSPFFHVPEGMARVCRDTNLYVINDINQIEPLINEEETIEAQERKTVLLVDDDNQVLKSFTRLLRGAPWNVYAVSHAERALNILGVEKIDLVVTDIKMPGIHGLELISQIRKLHKDLPIVVCSGYPGMKDDMELKYHNISGFIEKPVDPEEFESQIAAAMAP